MTHPRRVYIGLGSNIGDREAHLRRAVHELNTGNMKVLRVSPIYETAPQGFTEQPLFLNCVLEIETALPPKEILNRCRAVERSIGRERIFPNGPRVIDIDILFHRRQIIRHAELKIPHPRLHERRFVLAPMADLEPNFRHPITGLTMRQLLKLTLDQPAHKTDLVISVDPPEIAP